MIRRYWKVAFVLIGLASAGPARAFNYVTDANGTWWGIQDAASPRVDTGSIRATQTGPGDCLFTACVTPPYSTTINGFGGIKVSVPGAPRFNGEFCASEMMAAWARVGANAWNGGEAGSLAGAMPRGGLEVVKQSSWRHAEAEHA